MKIRSNNIIQRYRERLQFITDYFQDQRFEEQIQQIEDLKKQYGLDITLIEKALGKRVFINCYKFAFDFDPGILNSNFVKYIVDKRILKEIDKSKVNKEDYILYFLNGSPKHAGKINLPYVTSKWGLGHVWNHSIEVVPDSYGDEVRFYKKEENKFFESAYLSFLETDNSTHSIHSIYSFPP